MRKGDFEVGSQSPSLLRSNSPECPPFLSGLQVLSISRMPSYSSPRMRRARLMRARGSAEHALISPPSLCRLQRLLFPNSTFFLSLLARLSLRRIQRTLWTGCLPPSQNRMILLTQGPLVHLLPSHGRRSASGPMGNAPGKSSSAQARRPFPTRRF